MHTQLMNKKENLGKKTKTLLRENYETNNINYSKKKQTNFKEGQNNKM